jgi:DNA-3-methyladenine glycosylase
MRWSADESAERREILELPTLAVARALLGWRLVRDDATGRRSGRIVELEAYIGEDDLASHARFGRTSRNAVMYGPPGRAYVYLVYGMHDCLNIVTEPVGRPAALLVRAVEPLEGADQMRAARERRTDERRRARSPVGAGAVAPVSSRRPIPDSLLAAGPGLVCAAFDLDRSLTGQDLFDPGATVRVEPPPAGEPAPEISAGPRVGIGYAGDRWTSLPWRLAITANPALSRPPIDSRTPSEMSPEPPGG